MKRVLKKVTAALLAATMVVGLAACGSGNGGSGNKSSKSGKVKIGVSIWSSTDVLGSQCKKMLDAAAKALDVEVQYVDQGHVSEKVTATRAHGETIFESAMSSAINAKIAKYLGRETVIGDALTLPWDIANDANIDKYGIQGVKRRIGMDIYGNLIVMFAGAKIGGIKGGSIGIFSVLGLTEIKEAIAPPLIENERKQADDSYLREINSNVID